MVAKPNKNPLPISRHLDLAAELMQAFNDHDPTKALSFMSASPIWEFAAGPEPDGLVYSGAAAVREVIESAFKNFPDISYKTLRTYHASESVIFEILVQSPSKNIKYQAVDILTFDGDDKIAIKRTYRKVVALSEGR
jgi:hypothetical protein